MQEGARPLITLSSFLQPCCALDAVGLCTYASLLLAFLTGISRVRVFYVSLTERTHQTLMSKLYVHVVRLLQSHYTLGGSTRMHTHTCTHTRTYTHTHTHIHTPTWPSPQASTGANCSHPWTAVRVMAWTNPLSILIATRVAAVRSKALRLCSITLYCRCKYRQ